MIIRPPQRSDNDPLVEIYEKFYANEFPLDLSTAFASVLAEKDGKIVGFGWLDLYVESHILLDKDARMRDKGQALKEIDSYGAQVAANAGMDQVHAFTTDPKFGRILEKHLHYRPTISRCFVKDLNNG